jgi:hypothetical protein
MWLPVLRSICLVLCLQLAACGSLGGAQLHTFQFDVRNSDVEILDYRYGEVKIGPTQADRAGVDEGQTRQQVTVGGYLPRGETLYVKWRIRATGEVREDTVDLKSRLPRDISNRVVTFKFIRGALFVYLVTREVLPVGQHSDGPAQYDIYKVFTIYPDSASTLRR